MAADGSIIIDTRIDTSGFKQGSVDVQKTFSGMSQKVKAFADTLRNSFSKSNTSNISDGVREENSEIKAILDDTERTARSKAASIAAIYRKQGLSQEEAFKKAWQHIERTSDSGSKKVKKHLGGIGKKSKSVGNEISSNLSFGISSAVRKIGSLIGTVFAVRSIINFGKEALELGSDLQEVQNVVDVTFTTMSDMVNEFAQNMATAAGLSETMAKRYVGTYGAMSKSFGFAEAEAYEMSTTLTKLTGDVASFYNITQDMAYTKLKSVFTGETESLKDLGVVMTQSALDAYAMANGFGKTTSAMTEQEKVALRYRFVLDQLSAASGDFIRTADGWANQTRILKLQFDSLKASIGQGLINLLTPALQMINALLAKLNTLAASFKSFTEMLTGKKSSGMASGYKAAAQSAESLATAITGVADATKEAAKAAEGYLSPLDEINKMSTPEAPSSSSTGGGGASIDYRSIENGGNIAEETTESFNKVLSMFKPLNEAWSEYGDSISKTLKDIGREIVDSIKEVTTETAGWFSRLNWKPVFASFDELLKVIKPLTDLITGGFAWAYKNVLLPFGKWTIEKTLPAGIEYLSSKVDLLVSQLKLLAKVFRHLYDKILKDFLSMLGDVAVNGIGLLSGFTTFVSGIFSGDLEKAFTGIEKMLLNLEAGFNTVLTYIKDKIMIPFDRFLSEVFVIDWRGAFGILGNSLNGFSSSMKTVWDGIKQQFSGVNTFIRGIFSQNWKQAWDGVKQIFVGILTSLAGFVSTPINSIIGMINALIESVVHALNSITDMANNLLSKVPSWINPNKHYYKRLNAPTIPYLATGAVIPPNAPFMAMLGDQRHGNNIEAPESLIRRIVREESGGGGKGYTFVGQINRRVLFEEFITEAKLRQQSTGKNPFEFA